MESPRPPLANTYIPGEDPDRLAASARHLGLQSGRERMKPVREAVGRLFSESVAIHMHSVGALGVDERVDNAGSLHYVSVRRRKKKTKADYGSLDGLFQQQEKQLPAEIEEGEEEEEEVIEDTVEGGSLNAAIFGIIKGTVGPAILYLPHGFQASGYGVAIPAMIFATAMFIYNAYRLLDCWKVESDKNHKMAAHIGEVLALLKSSTSSQLDSDTAFSPTLLTYPELARRALGPYAIFVELGIALMQFGVCLTYLIFVPQNLRECTFAMTGIIVPKVYFLVIMLLIEIPLGWIKDIRKLTPTNVVATILIAYGLVAVLGLAFVVGFSSNDTETELVFTENIRNLPAWTDTWFIFVGTSFFMMEGSITLLVPLQEAVFLAEDKKKFPKINQVVTSWICVFYVIFSLVCVTAFGDGIRTAMTASLHGPLATTVQLAYSVAVILTFPLQAFPAMQVAAKAILGVRSQNHSIRRSALATILILLLGVIAVLAIDYLGNVVSILGSLFGIPLALVFPPLMHNILIKDSSSTTKWMNYGVVVIGFLAMGAASFATIVSWDKGAEDG